ncbi:hypothetical protein TcasGA2_TC011432 [Tribolium castaneum]|uniref:Protein sleepless n=1 Tax=Tribolium castaneum TaxID=7070 RepID=D6X4L5_TRICA|nr:hypothetical protein TcasGA2_TC011432 [Tribolium castaneum]
MKVALLSVVLMFIYSSDAIRCYHCIGSACSEPLSELETDCLKIDVSCIQGTEVDGDKETPFKRCFGGDDAALKNYCGKLTKDGGKCEGCDSDLCNEE